MANTDCKKILNLIPLYIDNCLEEDDTYAVKQHISSCDACKKEYEFLLSIIHTANQSKEPDISADFHAKLMAKAQDLKKKRTRRIILLKRGSAGVAAAVVAMCVVSFGSTIKTQDTEPYKTITTSPPDEKAPTEEKEHFPPDKKTAPKKSETPKTEVTTPASVPATDVVTDNHTEIPPQEEPVLIASAEAYTAARISAKDATAILTEILSAYEKDSIGYIVPDIDAVLEKISEESIYITKETSEKYTQNYIIVE